MVPPPAIQSVAVPNSKEPGYSPIYRNAKYPDKLQAYETSEVTTLFESFERSAKQYPKNDCLGTRPYNPATKTWGPYVWESYETVHKRRTNLGGGLLTLFERLAHVILMLQMTDNSPIHRPSLKALGVLRFTLKIEQSGSLPILHAMHTHSSLSHCTIRLVKKRPNSS
jgi:hypothetical protein